MTLRWATAALTLLACRPAGPPQLPDPDGWGLHVLARDSAPDGSVWVGTYGEGIWVRRPGARAWENLRSDTAATSMAWNFVHAFLFQGDTVWYGTLGNGWGRSTDGGRSWRNWTFGTSGPEYQYVVPDGLVRRGDTVYVATTDGIKVTWDGGASWRVITDSAGEESARDPVFGRLRRQYVFALALHEDALYASHVGGVEVSRDGGRTWRFVYVPDDDDVKIRRFRVRPTAGAPIVEFLTSPRPASRAALTPRLAQRADSARPPRHLWFARPVASSDQPHVDQTYRYGSTMGGNFQEHQGVDFNNGAGAAVRAIGSGTVVYAGPAEAGALTVAVRHDSVLVVGDSSWTIFSTYYHNVVLGVERGDRIARGAIIAGVGNTGRATNDHVHLEIHVVPSARADSTALVVNPTERFPRFTTNPELWMTPLPRTGIIAGTVVDAEGRPVRGARIYGIDKPLPAETPLSFVETYGERTRGSPAYGEHFAISDVPPGDHIVGVEIDGRAVYRRLIVSPGRVTWLDLRP